MKPYLKWAGGKARLATRIREEFGGACEGVYIEPFCGALAVFLDRVENCEINSALLADANERLIETHRAVQQTIDDVLYEVEKLPWGDDWKDHYATNRARFNETPARIVGDDTTPEHAALFIWINKTCFNGLYRVNRSGKFNVPAGSYKRPSRPAEADLRAVSQALQCAELVCMDYDLAFAIHGGDMQYYLDPPYAPLSATADFTAYTKGGFDYRHQMKLALNAADAADQGAKVIASNHDVPEVRGMYERLGFRIHALQVQRSVGASSDTRKKVGEILAVR